MTSERARNFEQTRREGALVTCDQAFLFGQRGEEKKERKKSPQVIREKGRA